MAQRAGILHAEEACSLHVGQTEIKEKVWRCLVCRKKGRVNSALGVGCGRQRRLWVLWIRQHDRKSPEQIMDTYGTLRIFCNVQS